VPARAVAGFVAGKAVGVVGLAGGGIAVRGVGTLEVVFSVAGSSTGVALIGAALTGVEAAEHIGLLRTLRIEAKLWSPHHEAVGSQTAVRGCAVCDSDVCALGAVVVLAVANLEGVIVDFGIALVAVSGPTVIALTAEVAIFVNATEAAVADAEQSQRARALRHDLTGEAHGAGVACIGTIGSAERTPFVVQAAISLATTVTIALAALAEKADGGDTDLVFTSVAGWATFAAVGATPALAFFRIQTDTAGALGCLGAGGSEESQGVRIASARIAGQVVGIHLAARTCRQPSDKEH
jgi:hypothetical protein